MDKLLGRMLFIALVLCITLNLTRAESMTQFYKCYVSSIYDTTKFTADLKSGEKLPVTLFATLSVNRSTEAGGVSRELLKTLIYKKNITLEVVSEDADGKIIGIVYLENGTNLNQHLLRMGWVFFDYYNTYYFRDLYQGLEKEAKTAKFGIWSFSNVQIPDALKPITIIKSLIGTVVSVYDGDTLTLQKANGEKETIRFHGIDCPERDQTSGIQARDFARSLVLNKKITVEVSDIDKYGRNVGVIKTAEGLLLNREMVKNGWAWHYKMYSKFPEWQALEDEARAAKLGIWGLPEPPLPPWEFRNGGNKTLPGPTYPTRNSGLLSTDPDVEVFNAQIINVHDGDTFNVYYKGAIRRLRMYGIDAPEINQLGGDGAQIFAERLLKGNTVTVRVKAIDQYDRSVAILVLASGELYNEKALAEGWAWHYRSFSDDSMYAALEQSARMKKLGIWGLEGVPVAPWDFRNGVVAYSGV